jgi:hypothetical protein
MSQTKHTKGPWVRRGADTYRWQIETVGDVRKATVIARITTPSKGGPDASDANAHLIAAAPDMLEALEAISPMLPRSMTTATHGDPVWTDAIRKVDAAIKKARGEQ